MGEILGNRYEGQENRNNENISVFDSQKYQNDLQGFYKNNINNPDSIQTLKDFIDKQDQDKSNLRENLEKPVLNETREQLDKEAMINEAKTMLYEKVGIDNNLENNTSFENFIKGVIDGGIIDNYDLAIQVYETNGKIILDGLEQLLSWEGIKNLANAIGEDIWTLYDGNAYEKGKVSAEVVLALLTAGAGLTINVAKKGVKLGIKELSKLRVNKERLVENPEVKNVINETNTKLDDIVPKKEVDLNKVPKKRINIERQVDGLKELGLPESYSRDLLESGILKENFFGGDLLKRFNDLDKKGADYHKMVNDGIEEIRRRTGKEISQDEALLMFSYTDEVIYRDLNNYLRGTLNKTLTPDNEKAIKGIVTKLKSALNKMPDLDPSDNGYILRGDEIKHWMVDGKIPKKGHEHYSEAFLSVSNNLKDSFIGKFGKDAAIYLKGKQGEIKDISPFAIAVNFGGPNKQLKRLESTDVEGVILPDSTMKLTDDIKTNDKGIYIIKATQK